MLYYKKDAAVTECPQTMRLEDGFFECTNGVGWEGPECDSCKFGFDANKSCGQCIENGLWVGTVNARWNDQPVPYTVHFTFEGDECATLTPGENMFDWVCLVFVPDPVQICPGSIVVRTLTTS